VQKPTVAPYALYFKHLQAARSAKESGAYGEAPRHDVMVTFSYCGALTVGFGFAAAHPCTP
jgi:hypothetical protein